MESRASDVDDDKISVSSARGRDRYQKRGTCIYRLYFRNLWIQNVISSIGNKIVHQLAYTSNEI